MGLQGYVGSAGDADRVRAGEARRAAERAAVAAGKKPFYQKPAAARREALVAKFEALKASGKLEAAMAKRRKKNAAKAHRHMPYRREV